MKKIEVKTNTGKYPVYIGTNILNKIKSIFNQRKIKSEKFLIIFDNKKNKKYKSLIAKKLSKKKIFFYDFKYNEKNKNIFEIDKVIKFLLKNNFSRSDCVIAIGGGIVGDFSCFVASIYKRGIKFINIPTTLLAQVDASIGGKSGVNDKNFGKNLIGTFYQPSIVISDTQFLKSLNKRQIICGYAEILKHALIASKKNFTYLVNNYRDILNIKNSHINKTILLSCKIKKMVVEKDEKENNLRKILNFGHTFGHAYEAACGFKNSLNHGEGVILGMKSAIKFSYKKKLLKKKIYEKIINHIVSINPNLNVSNYFKNKDIKNIIRFMQNDKKNKNSKINLVLLNDISKPIINKSFSKIELIIFFKNELINL